MNGVGIARNPLIRAIALVWSLLAAAALLYWRGPDWNTVYHAFEAPPA